MRVISGTAKGRKLQSVPGDTTRPIADRVKVALFDILAGELNGAVFLDLFAGTGGVGIEALSRGAKRTVFIDNEPLAVRTVRDNLAAARLERGAEVIRTDSFHFLNRRDHASFDFIYIAPPQYQGLWERAIRMIDAQPEWLSDDGQAIVQINPREYKTMALVHLVEYDQRKYGNTLLVFYEKPGE